MPCPRAGGSHGEGSAHLPERLHRARGGVVGQRMRWIRPMPAQGNCGSAWELSQAGLSCREGGEVSRIWDKAGCPLLLPTVGSAAPAPPCCHWGAGKGCSSHWEGWLCFGGLLGVASWDLGLGEGRVSPSPTGAPGAELLAGAAVPQLEPGACPQLLCMCWGHEGVL